MNENRRTGGTQRQGDCIVYRYDALEVKRLNQQIAEINEDLSARMGIGISRIQQPPISELISVFNAALEECYLIFIHRFNRSAVEATQVRELVKLSERRFAPTCARELRLATPGPLS